MVKQVQTVIEAQFDGFVTRKNGDVDLKIRAPYSELINVMKLLQMIDCNITVKAKINQKKAISLGTFWLYKLMFDKDGESKITFNTEIASSEYENFKSLFQPDAVILLQAKATVDVDDEEEDEEEDDE